MVGQLAPKNHYISMVIWGNGEPRWIRTIDPLIKSQMLYRLSYRLRISHPLIAKSEG